MPNTSPIAKPIAHSLSPWGSRTEILYMCPACGCDFRILGNRNHFCFNCGQEIQWQDVGLCVTEKTANEYHSNLASLDRADRAKKIIVRINSQNGN